MDLLEKGKANYSLLTDNPQFWANAWVKVFDVFDNVREMNKELYFIDRAVRDCEYLEGECHFESRMRSY